MIITQAPCYFFVNLFHSAADAITSKLIPAAGLDIASVTLISKQFGDDISCGNALDGQIEALVKPLDKKELSVDIEISSLFIPNVKPSFDIDEEEKIIRFNEVDGNPYTIKSIQISNDYGHLLVLGKMAYEKFTLPSFQKIIENKPYAYH